MEELILPVIHMNGSGSRILSRDYDKAYSALLQAIEEFQSVTFHSRDYYVISPDAFEKARVKRAEMYEKLESVREYLEIHINHVS